MSADAHPRAVREPSAAPLARLTAALDRWTCAVCVALFVAILVVMVFQVTFRYALNAPLTWTEELARYLFIWACFLGAPVATRRGSHVTIAFVSDRLPRGAGRVVGAAVLGMSLLFFLQLAFQGAILTARSHTVEAITVPIPWSLIYLAVPLSAVLMILQTVEVGWKALRQDGQEARA